MTMTASEVSEGMGLDRPVLVICDNSGKVLAISNAGKDEKAPSEGVAGKHIADLFGQSSSITRWASSEIAGASNQRGYSSETVLDDGPARVFAQLDSLEREGESYGFALRLYPAGARSSRFELNEGDSIVTQKQWHEIKNYIGALKLYATFLTRRMEEGDERQTVEKMLNGINLLIDYIAKIRRGEMQ
jgi:hypothetical protein